MALMRQSSASLCKVHVGCSCAACYCLRAAVWRLPGFGMGLSAAVADQHVVTTNRVMPGKAQCALASWCSVQTASCAGPQLIACCNCYAEGSSVLQQCFPAGGIRALTPSSLRCTAQPLPSCGRLGGNPAPGRLRTPGKQALSEQAVSIWRHAWGGLQLVYPTLCQASSLLHRDTTSACGHETIKPSELSRQPVCCVVLVEIPE